MTTTDGTTATGGTTGFTTPATDRYLEDYVQGSVHEFGGFTVTEADIIGFAQRFDPQPIHVDAEAARQGAYGGLIASGWHTAAVMMRLIADNFLPRTASLGSPGVDELRWTRPVRPGDTLSVRLTVVEARRSRSKPDRGVVRTHVEVRNQHAEAVMTLTAVNLIHARTPPPQDPRPQE